MFRKPRKLPTVEVTRGWTPELIQAVTEYASDHGLGFPSKDYDVLVDGFVMETNNFQTKRKAYGRLALSVGEHAVEIHVPVVTYFILEGEEEYSYFQDRIHQPQIVQNHEQERIYGRAILNGRYVPKAAGKEDLIPVFEWHLFLQSSEWHTVRDALQMCGPTSPMRLVIRVGMPKSITPETITKDSMNTRLLIHRIR